MPVQTHRLPPENRVVNWTQDKVALWLKKVQLEDCIGTFKKREIDGKKLLELTDEKLLQWRGDLRIKQKTQIMKYVRDCKNQGFITDKEPRKPKHSRSSTSILPGNTIFSPNKLDSEEIDDGWDTDFDDEEDDDTVANHDANEEATPVKTKTGEIDCDTNKQPSDNRQDGTPTILSLDVNHNNNIIEKPLADETENTIKIIPKPPDSRPSMTNYPKFTPLKSLQSNQNIVKRPQTVPPPPPVAKSIEQPALPPPIAKIIEQPAPPASLPPSEKQLHLELQNFTFEEEDYEIPNSSSDTCPTSSSSSSSVISGQGGPVDFIISVPLSPQDVYESLDGNEGKLEETLKVPEVPPEIVPCTRSPSSRHPNRSPSLPPRRMRGSPVSGSPPPLPKKPNSPQEPKPREPIFIQEKEKTSLMNRPLPLPPSHDVTDADTEKMNLIEDQETLKKYPWYHAVERNEADELVKKCGLSGTYLLRESRRGGASNPFTLTILYNNKVYHLNIRKRADNLFALGRFKPSELTFVSLTDLVKTHQTDPILLSSKNMIVGQTCLLQTPLKES